MSKTIYAIDRLINKPVAIQGEISDELHSKDMCIYKDEDGKEMVAEILWYDVRAEKKWTYVAKLESWEKIMFEKNQDKAKKLFVDFKKSFKAAFPESKPITARMNLSWNHVYFYFYAETRFNFSDFVRSFRQKIGMKFFIYQVWARDRVRLHPNLDERYDPSGLPLTYHLFKHSLPWVDGETISVQQLGWRNNDRLKDRSGKLDHTLNFEKDFYVEENKKYPHHGQVVSLDWKLMKCTWYNVLTWEIHMRWKADEDKKEDGRWHGEFQKIDLETYQKNVKKVTWVPSRSRSHRRDTRRFSKK